MGRHPSRFSLFVQQGLDSGLTRAEAERRARERLAKRKRLDGLNGDRASLEAEVLRLREVAQTVEEERRARIALERQLIEYTGSHSEKAALREAQEREQRVELLRRQVTRRIMNADLANGWRAWYDYWSAKSYSMGRLREVANRFATPALASAFEFWADMRAERCREQELESLANESKSLEVQLRQARFEATQLEMVRVARDDENLALRTRVREQNDEISAKAEELRVAAGLATENAELKRQLAEARGEVDEFGNGLRSAESDLQSQRQKNKALLEKLLAEQRRSFEAEVGDLRAQLNAAAQEQTRIDDERRAALEAELAEMRDERDQLKAALAEAKKKKAPSPVSKAKPAAEEPKGRKKGTSPLGQIDLDEGPDSAPISEQLAAALRKGAGKVLDLFRDWDVDGDGEVSRKEFHKAMPALGLEVPKAAIDELFSQWDASGDGAIGYKELQKILAKRPPAAAAKKAVTSAKTAMSAVSAFSAAPGMAASMAAAKEKMQQKSEPPSVETPAQ